MLEINPYFIFMFFYWFFTITNFLLTSIIYIFVKKYLLLATLLCVCRSFLLLKIADDILAGLRSKKKSMEA